MKRDSWVLLIAVLVVVGAFSGGRAYAYEIPSAGSLPVPSGLSATTTASSTYDFGSSFGNLATPFTNFWNSMQSGNVVPQFNLNAGLGTASTTIAFKFNPVQYVDQWVNQFDMWFYEKSGVRIDGVMRVLVNIIWWCVNLANAAVQWIVGLFH